MPAAGTVNILEKELALDANTKRYSFQELQNATNHFKETLGEGSLGPVYRGRLSDGTDVAIKMRSDGLHLNADSFLKEVQKTPKIVCGDDRSIVYPAPCLLFMFGFHTSFCLLPPKLTERTFHSGFFSV